MTEDLSPLQTKVLKLLRIIDMSNTTYRELGLRLGGKHPNSIKQAVDGLVRKGYLIRNERTREIAIPDLPITGKKLFLNIPILGRVSCGTIADGAYEIPGDMITITPSIATIKRPELTFALIASGDLMTRADIRGKSVHDGDYVIIEKADYNGVKDGDYIISRYNDAYNLKRIKIDRVNRRFILFSESSYDVPMIIVAEEDIEHFEIGGIAVDVIKGVWR